MLTGAVAWPTLRMESRGIRPRHPMLGWQCAVIALVLTLQLVYFTGTVSSDDMAYYTLGRLIEQGQPIPNLSASHMTARFVFIAFTYAPTVLFPHFPHAIALTSMAACAVVLLFLAQFAHRHLGGAAACLAMAMFGLVPLNIVLATIALPDMLGAMFAIVALTFAAPVLLDKKARHATLRSLIAGFLLGMAFNVKEPAALLMPGLILFVMLHRRRDAWAWARIGWMMLAVTAWLLIAEVVLYQISGEWLFHFKAMKRSQRVYLSPHIDMTLPGLLKYWTEYLWWMIYRWSPLVPMGWVLLAGLGYRLFRRHPVTNLLICAIAPGLVYISIGSSELTDYYPLIHQPRHMLPFLPAMALIAADAATAWWRAGSRQKRFLVPAGLVILALTAKAPNLWAGRMMHAQTFTAGLQLAREHLDGIGRDVRLCASHMTANRFENLPDWLDCPDMEQVLNPPTTPEQWRQYYGGYHVLVSRFDRIGAYKSKHDEMTLSGEPMEALATFERVARREPPVDRLHTLLARLSGKAVPTDPELAVELWYISPPIQPSDSLPTN